LKFIRPKIANYQTNKRRNINERPLVLSVLLVLSLTVAVSGCGGKKRRDMQSGAEELYERGTKSMGSGNFRNAVGYFENLEARYPFSNQEKSTTQRLLRLDLAKRPPVQARESFSAFSRLIQRYPNSIYAPDARQRMIFLRNRLAEHENYVANYYFKRGAYVAALNRAKYSMETFDGAPAIAESLVIMVLSYEKLGMSDLASDTRKVLELNYPETKVPKIRKNRRFTFF
jgi:outer membrane protein assembly factor BamD